MKGDEGDGGVFEEDGKCYERDRCDGLVAFCWIAALSY